MLIARVLPDVSGLDRAFDYLVPEPLGGAVEVGTRVRVDLHGRKVGGWILSLGDDPGALEAARLKPILRITGAGPSAEIIDLAGWASVRWAAGRIRPFLVTASPERAVVNTRPPSRSATAVHGPTSPATTAMLGGGTGGVLRLPPRADVMPTLLSAVAEARRRSGSVLVVAPGHSQVALLGIRLARSGLTVASVPDDWAAARAGVDVVIGSRSAAWAPCAGLAVAVVVDEHDEALQEERAPTWHARDVLVERCRRARVPLLLVSPAPTLTAVVQQAGEGGVVHPPAARERAGWPAVTVIDRSDDDPWKRSLVTSPLIEQLRIPGRRIVCVSNITGRARVLACRNCRTLQRCERCEAAVGLDDDGRLHCRRCGTERPPVCQHCGHSAFANLRPGVTRLREELAGAANRPVAVVTGASDRAPERVDIHVGTEAVLHRIGDADVVVFLEFDSEMLAPRLRAAEHAIALIARAGRIAPEVMVQTFTPDHEVLRAAVAGDPSIVTEGERVRRQLLSLPPFGALARVSGPGSGEFVDALAASGLEVGRGVDQHLVRAADWMDLGERLNATERPPGSKIRIEVDPARV